MRRIGYALRINESRKEKSHAYQFVTAEFQIEHRHREQSCQSCQTKIKNWSNFVALLRVETDCPCQHSNKYAEANYSGGSENLEKKIVRGLSDDVVFNEHIFYNINAVPQPEMFLNCMLE